MNDGKCGYCGSEYSHQKSTKNFEASYRDAIIAMHEYNEHFNSLTNVMTPNEIRTLHGYHVEYGHGKFEKGEEIYESNR